ncbi:hypothetical protein V5E97_14825 [Singulisphaera sp. Ch08]|uniref:Uncharacterized protein n=1 Tax=Singulisphaera sp. Ch08 TaxID=3120278 RepID=A0AAU7CQD5_9BACT
MTSDQIAVVKNTLSAVAGYLALKRAASAPTAQTILVAALNSTGHASVWVDGSLSDQGRREVLEAIVTEGKGWFRASAETLLDDITPKALLGAAKDKVSGFFNRAGKYVRELFTAGVLAVTGPGPANQTEAIIQETAKQVATQREYLANFQQQIVAEARPLNETFVARAEMYESQSVAMHPNWTNQEA